MRLRGGGDGEPSDYMKKQKEKQKECGTCVAIITGSSSGKARARVDEVCGRVAVGEFEGQKYCGLHMRLPKREKAKAEAKTCVAQIVTNDKRLSKKQGDMCGKNAKHECKGKWYCGFHIHIAMAEAMAEMKIGEGEDEGEDEGEPFVPFAHDLD